jgi:glucose-1-phosphate cytidylyltransferase
MKTIILAGGLGTRISEETDNKPKPMVLLDENPIIWHLMNIYAKHGHTDFVVAAGYKSEVIFEWVKNLKTDWKIKVIDTGLETQTGGRIKKCMEAIGSQKTMVTYGDGLGNVNIAKLLEFHAQHRKQATVTAVRPPARFGQLTLDGDKVTEFGEKQHADGGWINGGFFVIEPQVVELIKSDLDPFETSALPALAKQGQLRAFHHEGFWQPMDTLREKNELSDYAKSGLAPWLAG